MRHDSRENGPVLQRNQEVGIEFLWNRIHTCGPGQESNSRCAVKDRIILGSDSTRRFCPRHRHTKNRNGPGRQATRRDAACPGRNSDNQRQRLANTFRPNYSNRTGLAVRPVKYRTGAFTGPVHLRGSECNRTSENRLNRPVFRSNQ